MRKPHHEDRKHHHLHGRVFRDERGREGYGEDLGGREGYGMGSDRPEGYGLGEEEDESAHGRERPNQGGGDYGQEFGRREHYGQDRIYGRDFGGWETHRHDFSGRVHAPPAWEYRERSGGGLGGRHASGAFTDQGAERPVRPQREEAGFPTRVVGSGQHANKGPRGYTRSDVRIHEDVCEAMLENPDLDASDMEVTVEQGLVYLRGTAASRAEKRLAEDLAASTRGVKDVHNELRIQPPGSPAPEGRSNTTTGGGSAPPDLH